MNILLINPPSENEIIGNNPTIIEEERGYNPPLGLLYIAAYLEKHTTHEVRVLDAQVERLSHDDIAVRVQDISPDVVGITAMTLTLLDVLKVVKTVKKVNDEIKVVLGGPHVHIFPEETVEYYGVDYLVLGEGEVTFKELLDNLNDSEALRQVKGLVYRNNDEIITTGKRELIDNLDELPFPARHLTPFERYSSLLAKRSPITTMFTSRGCPYGCSFCDRPHLGKKFRYRSAQNVVDEMEQCVEMGIREFFIYDDTFTVNHERVHEICDEILERRLDIGWDIRTRVDNVNEPMLLKLKQAGCERIHYGVEAGTDKILKILNKGITLEQVTEVFKMTHRVGIATLAYFMIGSPGETESEMRETFRFMKRLKPDFVHMTILTPFPATKIYADGLKSGVIEIDYWRNFAASPDRSFEPPHWGELYSRKELNEILVRGYKSFYVRPIYILKRALKIESLAEFKKIASAGLKVVFMK